jgi:cation transporter-like permease
MRDTTIMIVVGSICGLLLASMGVMWNSITYYVVTLPVLIGTSWILHKVNSYRAIRKHEK